MDQEHKDPEKIDLEAPRLARYMHTERMKVLSDAIERHHPLQYTPSLLYFESCSDGNWRNHVRESLCVTPTASEDFLEA